MDLSKLLHGLVEIAPSNSRPLPNQTELKLSLAEIFPSCYMDLSQFYHEFANIVICISFSCPLLSAKPILEAEVWPRIPHLHSTITAIWGLFVWCERGHESCGEVTGIVNLFWAFNAFGKFFIQFMRCISSFSSESELEGWWYLWKRCERGEKGLGSIQISIAVFSMLRYFGSKPGTVWL